eukprot:jgi/Chlat1/3317/Chrsp22S03413
MRAAVAVAAWSGWVSCSQREIVAVRCAAAPIPHRRRRGDRPATDVAPQRLRQFPEDNNNNNSLKSDTMRVFAVSDVHTDYKDNLEWVRNLSPSGMMQLCLTKVLVYTALVHANPKQLTLGLFAERFKHVFFVAGNHDLWVRKPAPQPRDSVSKLRAIDEICERLGVLIRPTRVGDIKDGEGDVGNGGLYIVPLRSWHHQSWDTESDITEYDIPPIQKMSMDYRVCSWPESDIAADSSMDSVARYFDDLNERPEFRFDPAIAATSDDILTFSHFLPRQELLPEKRNLFYPNLPKASGSNYLERRLRGIHGENGNPNAVHLFGHSHFSWDATHNGIRRVKVELCWVADIGLYVELAYTYVQAPLAYPNERRHKMNGGLAWLPFCIYDSVGGGFPAPITAHWSDYYKNNARQPDNHELAHWVQHMYKPVGHEVRA